MPQFILQTRDSAAAGPCGLCGGPVDAPAGTQLVVADTGTPVCRDCGQRLAPSLAALVNLADTAERVGRIGRHSVFPPLTALLDLASAAEKYTQAASAEELEKKAG
jgi:hypothetical protein